MISFIEGTLAAAGSPVVIAIADGAVGLAVQISSRTAAQLPAVGERVRFWTHLVVREDGWTLYGFPTVEERALFLHLIGVSGVGPRLALGMLSGGSPAEIVGYLRAADEKSLATLPGIGRKLAARLIVELAQRLPASLSPVAATQAGSGGSVGALGDDGLRAALAVLGALGLPPQRAEQALLAARAADASCARDLERWVRLALRAL